jgi:hypothetical protein
LKWKRDIEDIFALLEDYYTQRFCSIDGGFALKAALPTSDCWLLRRYTFCRTEAKG